MKTPLIAGRGLFEKLKILVEECQLDICNNQYVLSAAAHNGHMDCVKFLVEHGADPKKIYYSSSYNNYREVEQYFNEYLGIHNHQDFERLYGNCSEHEITITA